MSIDIRFALEEIARQQKANLKILEEIKNQSDITLEDIEAIQKRELEVIYAIDSIIGEQE